MIDVTKHADLPLPMNQAANQPSERQREGGGLKSSLSSPLPTSGLRPALALLLLAWLFQQSNQFTLANARYLFTDTTDTQIPLRVTIHLTIGIKSFIASRSLQ